MLLVGSILLKKYILHITLFLQVVYARPLSQLTLWKEDPRPSFHLCTLVSDTKPAARVAA